MKFRRSAFNSGNKTSQAYYFCFFCEDILIDKSSVAGMVPLLTVEKAKEFDFHDECFMGVLDDKSCFVVSKVDKAISDKYQWCGLRDVYLNHERGFSDIVGYANQIYNWNRNFCFCGRCGSETVVLPREHARFCKKCQLINYPRISPAIIVAIIRNDQILLARGLNFSDKQMFSVLAGFLEPGESLEDCVKREVFEEVGIRLKNLQYFKSQFWPFPDSLMIGFTADYRSGDIKIDETEISEAGWFNFEDLPKVPNKRSLSSELINWFLENRAKT